MIFTNMNQMAFFVKHNVAIVTILDLKNKQDYRVRRKTLDKLVLCLIVRMNSPS